MRLPVQASPVNRSDGSNERRSKQTQVTPSGPKWDWVKKQVAKIGKKGNDGKGGGKGGGSDDPLAPVMIDPCFACIENYKENPNYMVRDNYTGMMRMMNREDAYNYCRTKAPSQPCEGVKLKISFGHLT